MTEVRVLSATGMLGSGFMESSFERGISLKPHAIGCDAGSTDGGPAYLGAGDRYFSKESTKRDLRLMLTGCDRLDVPLIIGSCGMAGGDSGVDWMRDDHFDVEPLDMDARCTPQSVASHTLYENADPFLITKPDGTIDSTDSRYEALSDHAVRVYGSQFRKADRITIKLEGAELDGYQSVIVAGGREGHSGENVTYRERKENHHENLCSRSICSVRR